MSRTPDDKLPDVPKTHYLIEDPDLKEGYVLICAPIAIFKSDDKTVLRADTHNFAGSKVKAVKLPDLGTVYFSSGPVR